MKKRFATVSILVTLLIGIIVASSALADPITVSNIGSFRREDSANDVNINPGDYLFFRADAVPNGFANPPTTGVATQDATTKNLVFNPTSVDLNEFSKKIAYTSSLTGPWTLTFSNGTNQTIVTTPAVGSTTSAMPFVTNMSLSGSGVTPTFAWAAPGGQYDSVRIQIFDVGHPFPGTGAKHDNLIHVATCNPSLSASNNCVNFSSTTSYTLPSVLSSGQTLQEGHTYAVSINLDSLRDTGKQDNPPNILSESRSFFDFSPVVPGIAVPVYLPTDIGSGAYNFHIVVIGGQTVYIDPVVATGFDYEIGAGDPNFASVLLPNVGDGLFDLFTCGGSSLGTATAGIVFGFGQGGLSCFSVRGIETSAGIDPNNVTAFITGLTFTADGTFTGTMTPITTNVPEPSSVFLLVSGLLALAEANRRKR